MSNSRYTGFPVEGTATCLRPSVSGSASYSAGDACVHRSSSKAKSVLSACSEMLDEAFLELVGTL